MTPEKFLTSLDRAIKQCKDQVKTEGLQRVRDNLPDYPVVAKMEAEAIGLSEKFIEMLVAAYDVKPFIDVAYKKNSLTNGETLV
ncbi:MAG: hypothetical protein ACYSUK_00270 [Planctomycetota bacterium]|jgi:hypothetical protein